MAQSIGQNRRVPGARFVVLLLAAGVALSGHAEAQGPILLPEPAWSGDAVNQTMTLLLTNAKVGLGLTAPQARLHIQGTEVVQEPGAGYMVLGTTNTLHMQLDRNEIRVAGPSADTVGTLYLQRFGGPISIRSSQEVSQRVSFPAEGGLAIGTSDPYAFAVSEGFIGAGWPKPNSILAVDGDAHAQRIFADEGRFVQRLRVGKKGDDYPGGAWDELQKNATAMIGGQLTAHEIIVHIDGWADDVFDEDYDLRPLRETKAYVEEHHHLPDVPTEAEALGGGVNLGEMNAVLLRKVEELTLHAIDQQEQIDALKARIDARD